MTLLFSNNTAQGKALFLTAEDREEFREKSPNNWEIDADKMRDHERRSKANADRPARARAEANKAFQQPEFTDESTKGVMSPTGVTPGAKQEGVIPELSAPVRS